MTLRALVSTKDAGVIIGKAGKNVADLREQTGVKAGVSKVIPGVHERVLTVTGPVEAVAKVFLLNSFSFLTDLFSLSLSPSSGIHPHHFPAPYLKPLISRNSFFAINPSHLDPTPDFAQPYGYDHRP